MRTGKALAVSVLIAFVLLIGRRTAEAQTITPVGPLVVKTAVAGFQPAAVTGGTTYSAVLAFGGQMKVVAQLNANMPAATTLAVKVTGGCCGTSLGAVNLDILQRNVVIAATPNFFLSVNILYTMTATVAAGVIPVSSRIVTFTLLTYP
jgi:hypothetical protein